MPSESASTLFQPLTMQHVKTYHMLGLFISAINTVLNSFCNMSVPKYFLSLIVLSFLHPKVFFYSYLFSCMLVWKSLKTRYQACHWDLLANFGHPGLIDVAVAKLINIVHMASSLSSNVPYYRVAESFVVW